MERLGLSDGESALVRQGVGSVVLCVVADPRIPEECARLPAGILGTAALDAGGCTVEFEKI